MKRCYR